MDLIKVFLRQRLKSKAAVAQAVVRTTPKTKSKAAPRPVNGSEKSSSSDKNETSAYEESHDYEKEKIIPDKKSTTSSHGEQQEVLAAKKKTVCGYKLALGQAFNANFVSEDDRIRGMLGLCQVLSEYKKEIEPDRRSV